MTEWPWVKLWVEDIDNPRWLAVADMAGSSPAVAFHSYAFGQAHANRNDRAGGSVAGLRPQVIASFCRVAVDEIIRVFQAFRDLDLWAGDRIADWADRQKSAIRLATVDGERVSDEAGEVEKERRRRYVAAKVARHRARKRAAAGAEKRRVAAAAAGQEWLDLPVPWEGKTGEVTEEVTPVTSVTAHPDGHRKTAKNQTVEGKHTGGYRPQEEESESQSLLETKESNTARASAEAAVQNDEGNPVGRRAPLSESADKVVHMVHKPAVPPAAPELRARKKEMRRQKVTRFVLTRFAGAELERRLNGLMGVGDRDEQWWFDACDRERIAEGWDDMRDKETASWRRAG